MANLVGKDRHHERISMMLTTDNQTTIEKAKVAISNFFNLLKRAPVDQELEQRQFREMFLPNFSLLCDYDTPAISLHVEHLLYTEYIKRWEEEPHFRSVYADIAPHLRRVVKSAENDLVRVRNTSQHQQGNPNDGSPIVFFIIHVESELAHIQSLMRYLEAYRDFSCDLEQIHLIVVSLDGCNPGLRAKLAQLEVPLISLGDQQPQHQNGYLKLLKLASICKQHQPQAIVFVSLVLWMSTFFAARLAKTQIWWAMKYHAFTTPDIDGYICGSPDGEPRQLGGNHWETAPFGGSDWFAPELTKEATAVRSQMGDWKTVFGSIGREEKLRDPAFLDAVCGVLEANPNSIFLWTGKQKDEGIQRFFDMRGLTNRTVFIGWVNTRLYAQVIDIYLDSFPFPGGYTVYEAMAAQKPIVMMRLDYLSVGLQNNASPYYFSDNSEGMNGEVQRLFRKHEDSIFYPVAIDKAMYISFASRFANDTALSATVGKINSQFVERYMSNRKGMAAGYTRAIKKLIDANSLR
jgi:hypothetical protein